MLHEALGLRPGPLLGAVAKGVVAYAALILTVRLTGNRSLAKLRAFDFVTTIAMGSILASLVVSPEVPLFQGIVAFLTLLLAQYVVASLAVRWGWANQTVTNAPVVLFRDGEYLRDAMRRARVTREEMQSAMRSDGHADETDVGLVLLETNGELSVLGRQAVEDARQPTFPRDS